MVYRFVGIGTIEEQKFIRQVYKQQLTDETLKGSDAPRMFEGVAGDQKNKGMIFGVENLLAFNEKGFLRTIREKCGEKV